MDGWRGRCGLIVPSSNTTIEPEFARHLPEGLTVHAARMHLEDVDSQSLTAMAEEVGRCADLLATADVDVIAYGCTTGSLIEGDGYATRIEARITERTGVPAVATAASIKRAFEALDAVSISVATPYSAAINREEAAFLDAGGFEVVDIDGLGLVSNTEIGTVDSATVYGMGADAAACDPDAVFLSCTNLPTFEVLPQLEADVGTPVVTSNQATLWDATKRLGVDASDVGLGELFRR